MPGHPAVKIGAAHKKKFEERLTARIEEGGLQDAPLLARQVVLLLDGAFSTMLIHRDPAYIEAAGRAAAALLEGAGRLKRVSAKHEP